MESASELLYLGVWWLNEIAQPLAIMHRCGIMD